MKRFWAALLVCVFLLSACGGPAEAGSASPASASVSVAAPAPSAQPQPEPEPEPLFELGSLRISRRLGRNGDDTPGSVDQHLTDEWCTLLLYNDYETMEQHPLCAVEGCAHNNVEICPAFRPGRESIYTIHVAGGGVILQWQNEPTNQRKNFILEWRDTDGGNIHTLVEISGVLMAYGQFLTDDTALFMTVAAGSAGVDDPALSLGPDERALLRIDLASGEVLALREMENHTLMGFEGDELLLMGLDDSKQMLAFAPQYGTERQLAALPAELEEAPALYGGAAYYTLETAEGTRLRAFRPGTGEQELDVLLPGPGYELYSLVAGYALVTDAEEQNWQYVSLDSGSTLEPAVMAPFGGQMAPARIYGTWNGQYIVLSGALEYSFPLNGTRQNNLRYTYGAIPPLNYWAGDRAALVELALYTP